MFFLFLGAMLRLQKVTGYEHDKKTSVMILCHLKYGQIWRAKVQVRTVREVFFKICLQAMRILTAHTNSDAIINYLHIVQK